jgi:hypothetical protein
MGMEVRIERASGGWSTGCGRRNGHSQWRNCGKCCLASANVDQDLISLSSLTLAKYNENADKGQTSGKRRQ